MHIIVCLDNRNGMGFNHRRQSQDKALREHIFAAVKGSKLWMNGYSARQFVDCSGDICVEENFLELAKPGEYCFVENCDILPVIDRIESYIVYRWNREYPADVYFPQQLLAGNCTREDFSGNSHKILTKEVYSL